MLSHIQMSWAASFADVGPLVTRVVVGIIFLVHGLQKVGMGVGGTAGFLESLGLPFATVLAVLLIIGEVVGGIALILGVMTRFWAAVGVIISLVALFSVHFAKGFLASNGGYEFILLIGAVMLSLVVMGAGKYSVDRQIGL
ncbi:MAG: DoxX family protein [Candidatus Pacebacteria bacterium]|nr:DoxX family protein [Candidatus Paceibacterota bacterium]